MQASDVEQRGTEQPWPANAPVRPRPSEPQELEAALDRLSEGAERFRKLSAQARAELLRAVLARFWELSPAMVELGCRARGVDPASAYAGEEWLSGPGITVRAIRVFAETLEEIARLGAPRIEASAVMPLPHGGLAVTVCPRDGYDRVAFPAWQCDVWVDCDHPSRLAEQQAAAYQRLSKESGVALVLGAGNVGSISVLDVLHQTFAEGRVCLLKMSPANAYLGPLFERAFAPLVERGFLAFAYGGADVGAFLVGHPAVDALHITGSVETHDTIIWGPKGQEREERRRAGRLLVTKPITSELGNVTPVLVVPADYTDRELERAARTVVGMFLDNASFNCVTPRTIVTARGWPQRAAFLAAITQLLRATPTRLAYYPGAHALYDRLLATVEPGRAQFFGERRDGHLPWTFVPGLSPESDAPLFGIEPFCCILTEVPVDAKDPVEFLEQGPAFVNERLWGTLNASVIVPDRHLRDVALDRALARAVRALRYGTVGINLWPAFGYGMGTAPWGGAPGSTLADPQSGLGWGHNALLFQSAVKTVVRAPLMGQPEPPWNPGRRRHARLDCALAALQADPTPRNIARLAWALVR
nr:MAG: aldehyde dehydrogenase [Pseudomonadota bacterium]